MIKKVLRRMAGGYTLIELAVVILVISLLTGFVMQAKNLFLRSHLAKTEMLTKNSPINEIPGLSLWIEPVLEKSFSEKENQKQVSNWKDINPQDDAKINLTQSDANKRPTYVAKAINNMPALKFDGNDFLEADISDNPIHAPPLTIIAVVQAGNNNVEQIISSKDMGDGFEFGKGGNDKLTFKDHNGGSNFHFNYVFDDKPKILSFIYNEINGSNVATLYNNGVLVGSDSHGHSTGPSTSLMIGTKQGTAQFWDGYIAEIIIFNRLLLNVERQQIELYLARKYEIELG